LVAVVPHTHAPLAQGALLACQSVIAIEISLPNTLTMTTGSNATVIVFE
jgi:hypothetical protein